MGKADTSNDPAARKPLPPEGAENSSDPAALPAAVTAIDSENNDGTREAADEPMPAPAIALHPLAAEFPMRDETSIRELARHIGPNDPLDSVILYEGKVLDRWDLYRACLLAKREPRLETYAGDKPLEFLLDRHLNRGYLSESQRAMLAARACSFPVGGNQYSQGLSIGRASELLNVSPESISRAKKVLACGIAQLAKAVDDGVLKVAKAYTISKKQPQEQREELQRFLAADSPPGRPSATEIHNPPELGPGDTSQQVRVEPGLADADDAVTPELPDTSVRAGDQRDVACTSPGASGAPSSGSVAGTESSPPIPYFSTDEWIWPGYIPTPGVTLIVGGIKAPTSLVAMSVAATLASRFAWADRTCADKVIWLTAQRGTTNTAMALRNRLAAAGATYDRFAGRFKCVRIVEPELDDFGLPIHHLLIGQ